jgi:hypothetical protein
MPASTTEGLAAVRGLERTYADLRGRLDRHHDPIDSYAYQLREQMRAVLEQGRQVQATYGRTDAVVGQRAAAVVRECQDLLKPIQTRGDGAVDLAPQATTYQHPARGKNRVLLRQRSSEPQDVHGGFYFDRDNVDVESMGARASSLRRLGAGGSYYSPPSNDNNDPAAFDSSAAVSPSPQKHIRFALLHEPSADPSTSSPPQFRSALESSGPFANAAGQRRRSSVLTSNAMALPTSHRDSVVLGSGGGTLLARSTSMVGVGGHHMSELPAEVLSHVHQLELRLRETELRHGVRGGRQGATASFRSRY